MKIRVNYISADACPTDLDVGEEVLQAVLETREVIHGIIARALGEDIARWDGVHEIMCFVESMYWMVVETTHSFPGHGEQEANESFAHHITALMDAWRSHPMNAHRINSPDQGPCATIVDMGDQEAVIWTYDGE